MIYEELASCNPTCLHYKGRRRGSINFVSIEKYEKKEKDLVSNAVRCSSFLTSLDLFIRTFAIDTRLDSIFSARCVTAIVVYLSSSIPMFGIRA